MCCYSEMQSRLLVEWILTVILLLFRHCQKNVSHILCFNVSNVKTSYSSNKMMVEKQLCALWLTKQASITDSKMKA